MKKILIFLALAFAFLTNCAQKKSEDTSPGNSFPNTIGSTFIYAVTDSNSNKTYEVKVLIAGNSSLANGAPAQLWTFTYPDRIDTNYVSSNKDSVVFYDKTKTVIVNNYHLPLIVGAKWNKPHVDTTTVVSNQPLTVKAGTFAQTFLLKEQAAYPQNYFLIKNQWVVPKIGMVKNVHQ